MTKIEQGEFSFGLFALLLSFGVTIATSIWVAYDAKANRIPTTNKPYSIHNGALTWFISSIVLWIATFPFYLIRRRQVLKARRDAAVAAATTADPWTISFSVSRNTRTEGREQKADLSGYYDVAQICRNGHVITSHYNNCPAHRQEFCDQCGEPTLTKCESCGTAVRGNYDVPGVATNSLYATPTFCHACGKPYPWTLQKLQVAKELVGELDSLEDAEKQSLKQSLDDLIRDTPKTDPAFYRFKKLMRKVDRESFEAVKSVVMDLASESVKKSLEVFDISIPMGQTEFYTRPPVPTEMGVQFPNRNNGHPAGNRALTLESFGPASNDGRLSMSDTSIKKKEAAKLSAKARKTS